MLKRIMRFCLASALTTGLLLGSAGCTWNRGDSTSDDEQRRRQEKTREDVARATEQLKPELQEAGRKLGDAARTAGEQARAAAQGVREGWQRGASAPLDLNSATERELMNLPGITRRQAARIIRGRPYRDKRDLVTRDILSESSYSKIGDEVTAR